MCINPQPINALIDCLEHRKLSRLPEPDALAADALQGSLQIFQPLRYLHIQKEDILPQPGPGRPGLNPRQVHIPGGKLHQYLTKPPGILAVNLANQQ